MAVCCKLVDSSPPLMSSAPEQPASLDEASQHYEALRTQLRESLEKKRQVDHKVTDLESQIYLYEGSYLNGTAASGGNVIRGFDSYLKPSSTAATGTRTSLSATPNDERLFSNSSTTHQRSLALKANETELTGEPDTSAPTGYKLKRKP